MMLTESLRDPFAHLNAGFDQIEIKSAPLLGVTRFQRPRRTLTDRVRSALQLITGGAGTVLSHEEKSWASITFTGTRTSVPASARTVNFSTTTSSRPGPTTTIICWF